LLDTYREYLESAFLPDFEEWRSTFVNPMPFDDMRDIESLEYRRNFDTALRQQELESDGIVGEVVFPNTIPPFFPTLSFLDTDVENPEELRLRWAGLRAHNRWLADFCAELPGRRAGVGQILLHDIESALDEIRRIKQSGLFGGVLLPIPTPGSGVAPLHAACYEPVWALCEELEVPIAAHGGGGVPNEGAHPASGAMIWVDSAWFSRRPLAHLIFGGVFERHPGLKFRHNGNRELMGPRDTRELRLGLVEDSRRSSIHRGPLGFSARA
jgi:hypothetical protein